MIKLNPESDNEVILSKKLRYWKGSYLHWCPGCDGEHHISVDTPNEVTGARWTFNGDTAAPTFAPSVNVNLGNEKRCHYFLTDGKLMYCADCHHELRGTAVDLPDYPKGW